MLSTLPFGLGVTVLRSAVTGRDAYGNDVRSTTAVSYTGCAVLAGSSTEENYTRSAVFRSRIVVLPSDAQISSHDQVQLDDGTIWDVEGEPEQQRSQLTGAVGGVFVKIRWITG